MKRFIFGIIFVIYMATIFGCTQLEESINYNDYKFEELLGTTQNNIISIFGGKYDEVKQGVNEQNRGMRYNDIGILIGLDEFEDIVLEIQFTDLEYSGISTKLKMKEVLDIMEKEALEINFNPMTLWYIYDFGDYRLRVTGLSQSENVDMIVITE